MDYKREFENLQREMDDVKWRQQQRQEREAREREEKRREERRAWQDAQLHANDWYDAFDKGIRRYRQEAVEEKQAEEAYPEDPHFTHDQFFQNMVNQAEFAQQAYQEAMTEARVKIAEIEKQARESAAAKVDGQFPGSTIAEALREDNPNYLTNW